MDWEDAVKLESRTLAYIKTDPELLEAWQNAKSDQDRNLIMIFVTDSLAYDRGYEQGVNDSGIRYG